MVRESRVLKVEDALWEIYNTLKHGGNYRSLNKFFRAKKQTDITMFMRKRGIIRELVGEDNFIQYKWIGDDPSREMALQLCEDSNEYQKQMIMTRNQRLAERENKTNGQTQEEPVELFGAAEDLKVEDLKITQDLEVDWTAFGHAIANMDQQAPEEEEVKSAVEALMSELEHNRRNHNGSHNVILTHLTALQKDTAELRQTQLLNSEAVVKAVEVLQSRAGKLDRIQLTATVTLVVLACFGIIALAVQAVNIFS